MKLNWQDFEFKDNNNFRIAKAPTGSGMEKPDTRELSKMLQADIDEIGQLQHKLYAENRRSLLIVLQGMDSAGKDGVIRHLMSGLNPQGLQVYSYKHPSLAEMEHGYLWRYSLNLPRKGEMVIFNRSHYENVLIAKVHPEYVVAEKIPNVKTIKDVDKDFWNERYRQIFEFESSVMCNGTNILKFFLHLSKDEQRHRFLDRIDNKEKHWKFSSSDIAERDYWDQYQIAYEDALRNTGSKAAPWYAIPADDKWFCHILIGKIVLEKLRAMNPHFPDVDEQEKEFMKTARVKLEKELKNGKL